MATLQEFSELRDVSGQCFQGRFDHGCGNRMPFQFFEFNAMALCQIFKKSNPMPAKFSGKFKSNAKIWSIFCFFDQKFSDINKKAFLNVKYEIKNHF